MHKFFETLTNQKGDVIPGSMRVVDPDSGGSVTIYSDEGGTPIAGNLALADDFGLVQFYVDDGVYHIDVYSDPQGDTFFRRVEDVEMISTLAAQLEAAEQVLEDTEAARDETVIAKDDAEAARAGAESAQTAAESAAAEAASFGGSDLYTLWSDLSPVVGTAGQGARVTANDTGTHTDPVVGGTVANSGNYRYSTSPAGWEWKGELESELTEQAAAILGVGGNFAQIPQKTSDGDADIAYVNLSSLADQPKVDVDLTSGSNYQLEVGTYTTNLSTRLSSTVSGTALIVNFLQNAIFLGGIGVPYKLVAGRRLILDGMAHTANTLANAGIGLMVSATAPTPGGALVAAPTMQGFTWRANGSVAAVNKDLGAGTAVLTGTVAGMVYALQQAVRIVFDVNDTADGGTLTYYVDGAVVGQGTISGLPTGGYARAFGRSTGTNTDKIQLSLFEVAAAGLPFTKRIFIDSASAVTPKRGTANAPWTTIAEANADYAATRDVSSLEINFKRGASDGVYRGELVIDPIRTRRCRISAVAGHAVRIRPSHRIAAGSAAWTNISGEFWRAPHRWQSLANTVTFTSGGLFDVTSGVSQTFGLNNAVTVPGISLYTRRAVDLTYTSLARGEYTVQQSGTYAGQVIVRVKDGTDPNLKDWEQSTYATGITVASTVDAAWNVMLLELANITVEYAYTYGIWARRCYVQFDNVKVFGTASLFGMELDECTGTLNHPQVLATSADCYHSAGSLSSDAFRAIPCLIFNNPIGTGAFTSTLGSVGDVSSNHSGHLYILNNPIFSGAGKDGLSAVGPFVMNNGDIRDCANAAVSLAPGADTTLERSYINGGSFIRNTIGAVLNFGSNNNIVADLDINGTYFEDSVRATLETFSNGTGCSGTMTVRNIHQQTNGAAPTEGHKNEAGLPIVVSNGELIT